MSGFIEDIVPAQVKIPDEFVDGWVLRCVIQGHKVHSKSLTGRNEYILAFGVDETAGSQSQALCQSRIADSRTPYFGALYILLSLLTFNDDTACFHINCIQIIRDERTLIGTIRTSVSELLQQHAAAKESSVPHVIEMEKELARSRKRRGALEFAALEKIHIENAASYFEAQQRLQHAITEATGDSLTAEAMDKRREELASLKAQEATARRRLATMSSEVVRLEEAIDMKRETEAQLAEAAEVTDLTRTTDTKRWYTARRSVLLAAFKQRMTELEQISKLRCDEMEASCKKRCDRKLSEAAQERERMIKWAKFRSATLLVAHRQQLAMDRDAFVAARNAALISYNDNRTSANASPTGSIGSSRPVSLGREYPKPLPMPPSSSLDAALQENSAADLQRRQARRRELQDLHEQIENAKQQLDVLRSQTEMQAHGERGSSPAEATGDEDARSSWVGSDHRVRRSPQSVASATATVAAEVQEWQEYAKILEAKVQQLTSDLEDSTTTLGQLQANGTMRSSTDRSAPSPPPPLRFQSLATDVSFDPELRQLVPTQLLEAYDQRLSEHALQLDSNRRASELRLRGRVRNLEQELEACMIRARDKEVMLQEEIHSLRSQLNRSRLRSAQQHALHSESARSPSRNLIGPFVHTGRSPQRVGGSPASFQESSAPSPMYVAGQLPSGRKILSRRPLSGELEFTSAGPSWSGQRGQHSHQSSDAAWRSGSHGSGYGQWSPDGGQDMSRTSLSHQGSFRTSRYSPDPRPRISRPPSSLVEQAHQDRVRLQTHIPPTSSPQPNSPRYDRRPSPGVFHGNSPTEQRSREYDQTRPPATRPIQPSRTPAHSSPAKLAVLDTVGVEAVDPVSPRYPSDRSFAWAATTDSGATADGPVGMKPPSQSRFQSRSEPRESTVARGYGGTRDSGPASSDCRTSQAVHDHRGGEFGRHGENGPASHEASERCNDRHTQETSAYRPQYTARASPRTGGGGRTHIRPSQRRSSDSQISTLSSRGGEANGDIGTMGGSRGSGQQRQRFRSSDGSWEGHTRLAKGSRVSRSSTNSALSGYNILTGLLATSPPNSRPAAGSEQSSDRRHWQHAHPDPYDELYEHRQQAYDGHSHHQQRAPTRSTEPRVTSPRGAFSRPYDTVPTVHSSQHSDGSRQREDRRGGGGHLDSEPDAWRRQLHRFVSGPPPPPSPFRR